MKRRIYKLIPAACKFLAIMLLGLLFVKNAHAQIINEGFEETPWTTLNGTSGQITITGTSASRTMSYAPTPAVSTALNTCPNSGVWWYSKLGTNSVATSYTKSDKVHSVTNSAKFGSSGYIISPITSSAIVSITFWASMGSPFVVGLATNPNATQPTYSSVGGTPSDFTNFSTSFPVAGNTSLMTSYSISYSNVTGPVRVAIFNQGGSSSYIDDIIITQPTGTPPSIANNTVVPGITDAVDSATVKPGTLPLLASGIIWSTTPLTGGASDTALTTKTWNRPSPTAGFKNKLSPLTPNQLYYAEPYVIGLDNTVYFGNVLSFTTLPKSSPIVSLNLTQVYSNKAAVTGNVVDSGGLLITEKGFVWNTAGNPSLTSKTGSLYQGTGTASFSDFIKSLKPNTHYCAKAYAKNSIGVGYSADTCFTTGAPVPTLTAVPSSLDFGQSFYNGDALTLSYTLSGAYLTGAPITITPPAGFLISTSTNPTTFKPTAITITYTGATLTPIPIYVKMPTTTYGNFSGNIVQAGGGTAAADADKVAVTGSVVQSPVDVSNSGSDFLLGFGYEEKMSQPAGSTSECRLSVYVTTGAQPATVHVVLNSGGYSVTQTIPANSYYSFTGFPTGDPGNKYNTNNLPDARLFSTGISNKSIHVYTDNNVPVSVFMHSYTSGNSAAGAMIFPTNTWNSSYTVQAFGGTSNNSNPNSYFFVIANEDNTVVTFTPTQPVLDASTVSLFTEQTTVGSNTAYNPGTPYTITLNKGQVFNAMGGFSPDGNGLDLSGSKVSTTCDKKITVFGGNGRCLVNTLTCTGTGGSDHMIQQMFPSVAWGTKYLTVPTTGATPDYFRIYFQDPTTVVKANGVTLNASTIKNGIYYEYQSATPTSFTSDKPINVSQFMVTPSCTTEGNDGGPEMIILSPVEQAIKSVVFYSPTSGANIITGGGASYTSYMNVVIPTSKASTFKLDGVAPAAASFKVHPQDPTYSYASLLVTSKSQHTLTADTGFVSIAYGWGAGESYGYNAGTQIKNLTSVQFTNNPTGGDSSATAVRTCVNNPVVLKIALPYLPSQVQKITWDPQNDPRILDSTARQGAMNGSVAKYDNTITVNGRTFYVYSSPVAYTFTQLGTYRFPVTAYGTFTSDCPGQDIENMLVIVGHDQDNLSFNASCGNPVVTLYSDTIPTAGTNILKWTWDFGDGTAPVTGGKIDTLPHTFPAGGSLYTVKLTTTNSVGCVSTDSVQIDFSGGLKAAFTDIPNTVCTGSSIAFADNSTVSGTTSGAITKWTWDFGDGSNLDSITGANVSHLYNKAGKWKVTLKVTTSAGCIDYAFDSVTIQGTPVASFTATSACLGSANIFTNTSSVPNNLGNIDSSFWDYGDGKKDTTLGTQNAQHTYAAAGPYITTLYVKSDGGCTSTSTTQKDSVFALPVAGFKDSVDCGNLIVYYTDTSKANGGTIIDWNWDFDGDGIIDTTTHNASPIKHYYPNGNGQTYKPTLTIKTLAGCTSVTGPYSFKIGVAPSPSFTQSGTLCLPNASAIFSNTSTISDGTTNQMTYVWHFADGSANADSSISIAAPPATAMHIYTTAGTYNVTITAKSNVGCTATSPAQAIVVNAQPTAVITPSQLYDCLSDSLSFAGNGTSGNLTINQWNWSFGDGVGTDSRQNPKYEWKTAGQKTVSLIVTSAAGCKSDSAHQVIRVDSLPVAGFTLFSVDCSSQTVTVVDTSNAHGGTIAKWDWDFGDGTPHVINTKGDTVKHVYVNGNGQSYIINLTVTTKDGCINSAIPKGFTIGASPAVAFALSGGNTGFCLPNAAVTFNNTSTIGDPTNNSISYYIWNFGDGTPDSTVNATTPPGSVTHVYTATTPVTVKLTAYSNKGCTSSNTLLVNNIYPQPVAVISAPPAVCLNDSATLSGNDATTTSKWAWDFGDGVGTSTKQSPKYAWSTAKKYTVSLTVTSTHGCVSVPADSVITVNPLPVADFTIAATTCEKNSIAFTDASSANVNTWAWDFGDASAVVTQQSPSHTYTSTGNYTVKLHVTDVNGCGSKPDKTSPIAVHPLPQPTVTTPALCLTGNTTSVTFTAGNKGTATVAGYTWKFDNDSIATGSTANYYYTHNGPQNSQQLTATSNFGCVDSITFRDTVYSTPIALDSIINTSSLCSNLPVSILNESYVPGVAGYGSISKIEIYWNYNAGNPGVPDITDNAPVTGKQYQKQYAALATDNNYTIRLNAYSGNGCLAPSADSVITVHGSPLAKFTPILPVCQEADAFALTTGSQVSNLPGIGSYSGLGVISDSAFNPSQAGPGAHPIVYTVTTTPYGCFDTAMQIITVYPTPLIDYGDKVTVMEGDSITLTPTHVVGIGLKYLWTPAVYLNSDTSATPVSKPADTVTYTITVKSPGGCQASTTLFVQVLRDFNIPNTFTPNGDGINDKWVIAELPNFPIQWVQIFDRYGQLLYESHGYSTPWDGSYKGKQLPSGTYYYIIELNGLLKPKTGYVTILR